MVTQRIIDLRSDTVTQPTPGMLDAMMSAQVGDDVFEDDPSVNQLQEFAASFFGKEAALYCPSGTMTNQIAIALQSGPLSEVVTEEHSHVYQYEVGGISYHSRASVALIKGDRGRITAEQVRAAINPRDVHKAETALVCVENTANRGGGACYQWEALEKIHALCRRENLRLHLDGARLCNAAIATTTPVENFAPLFDSISICLSKGLGAPVGSLVLGDRTFIQQARRLRKTLGGGMRQAGFLAAAGLYALQNQVTRLQEDHQLAQKIADLLRPLNYVDGLMEPDTNIIIFDFKPGIEPQQFVQHLKQHNILAGAIGGQQIRFVTHLDVGPDDLNPLAEALKSFQ